MEYKISTASKLNESSHRFSGRSWGIFFILELMLLLAFDFNLYYFIATSIFIYQFLLLFSSIGERIALRNLIGTLFSMNYLLSPVLMYSWLNPYTIEVYAMKGSPDLYFSYAIPAVVLLLAGLHLKKVRGDESVDVEKIAAIAQKHPRLPWQLIATGLFSQFVILPYVPSELSLFFLGISYFKFAGLFLSFFSSRRFNFFYLVLTYGFTVIQSLTSSMFNDLLNLLFFLGFFLAIRYKPSFFVKIAALFAGILLVVFIQNIKFTLRGQVTNSLEDISNLGDIIDESSLANRDKSLNEKIADNIFRFDEGWVTSNTMANYYAGNFDLQQGKHGLLILKSAVLPRILAPGKLVVGDRETFIKYTGKYISERTAIALGILSDGFIDFGYYGVFTVFAFGMLISFFIRIYHRMDQKYPLSKIFFPIAFFVVIRADTDTLNGLGSLIKISFIVWLGMVYLNSFYFKKSPPVQTVLTV